MLPLSRPTLIVAIVAASCLLTGCRSSSRPLLYPNEHLETVGREVGDAEVQACIDLALEYGVEPTITGGGEVAGATAEGAASGAARDAVLGGAGGAVSGAVNGAVRGVFGASREEVNPTFRRFVEDCLRDKGYDVVGWQ